jgi:hypothetical protein
MFIARKHLFGAEISKLTMYRGNALYQQLSA